MKLRSRLALGALAVSLPLLVALIWWDAEAQRRAAESSLIAFSTPYLERAGWREQCEANPSAWSAEGAPEGPRRGPPAGGPPRPPEGRRGPAPVAPDWQPGSPPFAGRPPPPPPRGGEGSPPPHSRPAQFFAYSDTLESHNPNAPVLGAAVRSTAVRQDVTLLPAPWKARTIEVLLRVPGASGPCAYLLARGTTEPWLGAILPPTHLWLTPLLVVFGAVLLALGPVVRRIRRLTAAVQRSALSQYAEGVHFEGNDEVAELARAFDVAASDVRAQLAERDRREQALRDFLANTTHDVMIPLTVLQGHLSELRGAASQGKPIDAAALAAAMDESHYIGALIGNLALATKLDSNAPELQRVKVDLNTLVSRVLARHRPIARELDVALECALPASPLTVEADLTMLEQAVSNVAYNAVRHNRPGGHVAVILEAHAGARFRLRVLDDGPGIAASELSRLAERGFRGNEARTRAPNGQGLGLNITQRVAELHAFTLSFQASEYGGLQVDLEGPLLATPSSGSA